jgi:transposase-like protein
MPYDEWYDDDTREAATARVLERRATKPGDRNVLTVVADEFGIPQQTLRAWVEEAAPEPEKSARKPRPKFSQVVTTRIEPAATPVEDREAESESDIQADPDAEPDVAMEPQVEPEPDAHVDEEQPAAEVEAEPDEPRPQPSTPDTLAELNVPSRPAPPARAAVAPPDRAPRTGEIAALEAEVAALRAGNRVLTEAMRVLLEP